MRGVFGWDSVHKFLRTVRTPPPIIPRPYGQSLSTILLTDLCREGRMVAGLMVGVMLDCDKAPRDTELASTSLVSSVSLAMRALTTLQNHGAIALLMKVGTMIRGNEGGRGCIIKMCMIVGYVAKARHYTDSQSQNQYQYLQRFCWYYRKSCGNIVRRKT